MSTLVLVETLYGPMDASLLEPHQGSLENENERTRWIEYWPIGAFEPALRVWRAAHPNGEIANGGEMPGYIHRSVDMYLKRPMVTATGEVGGFV